MFVSAKLTPDDQSDCPAAVSGDPILCLYHSQQYRGDNTRRPSVRQMFFSVIYVN
jgi:hypothetical protein